MPEITPEFYVGYQPSAPPVIRRTMRRAAIGSGAFSLLAAVVLSAGQGPFAASNFQFGVSRDYSGELIEWPYPSLLTKDAHYLLAGPGKHGVAELVRGHDGLTVKLRASLISRGPDKMLEIEPASLRFFDRAVSSRAVTNLGPVTLIGEIVDTKCHLGVMNPGEGKVHRECAARCISGGAPPGFLVRDSAGETHLLLLAGSDGRALGREVLDYVAEPVRISGHLQRTATNLVLLAEPRDFQRE